MNSVKILDTTLRDGSYSVSDQFTAAETREVSRILDEIGFDYIEIGPGIGMNAKKSCQHVPAESDEAYITSAREVVRRAKLGMFFIPGIAGPEQMAMAARLGLDFIRVGANVNQSRGTYEYLERARELGLTVCCNLMKSYAVSAKEFAAIANDCRKAGAEVVYLVDSAGGMLPEQVGEYVARTKDLNADIKVGFHGHDNLGLAVANTVVAVKNGAAWVDSSIRGLGRSSGNTVSEKLIFVLKRMGYDLDFDIDKMMRLGEDVVKPYTVKESALDIIYGYSQFHSAFLPKFQELAEKTNADVKDLIFEYTKRDKLGLDERLLEKIADSVRRSGPRRQDSIRIDRRIRKSASLGEQMEILRQAFLEQDLKFRRKSFFNISKLAEPGDIRISPVIHANGEFAFGSAEADTVEQAKEIIDRLGDCVEGILVDTNLDRDCRCADDSVFHYDDVALLNDVICEYIRAIGKNRPTKVYMGHSGGDSFRRSNRMGPNVSLAAELGQADIFVVRDASDVAGLGNGCSAQWVIVTWRGLVGQDIREKFPNARFILIDMAYEVLAEMSRQKRYRELVDRLYGCRSINGVKYCSGGFIGDKGTIVVDNVNDIGIKYGEATGDGHIDYYE